MKRLPFLMILLASVAACASDPLRLDHEPTPAAAYAHLHPNVGEPFELRPGEVASLEGGALLVALDGVTSDSRCPIGVSCVWAGDAEVTIGAGAEGGSWSWSELHTGMEPRSRRWNAFTITLEGVSPQARSDEQIPSGAYTATLRVTRD